MHTARMGAAIMANLDVDSARIDDPARRERLVGELKPVGSLQEALVEQIALGMGRLAASAAKADAEDPAWVRRQGLAERSFYRALAEFRRVAKADAKTGETRQAPTKAVEAARPVALTQPRPEVEAKAAAKVTVTALAGGSSRPKHSFLGCLQTAAAPTIVRAGPRR